MISDKMNESKEFVTSLKAQDVDDNIQCLQNKTAPEKIFLKSHAILTDVLS